MEDLLSGLLFPLVVALLLTIGALCRTFILAHLARRKVRRWLRDNTCDKPGKSHVSTVDIAKGTGLLEDRVRQACLSDKRIYRARGEVDRWSVWREEPRSVYEERDLLVL